MLKNNSSNVVGRNVTDSNSNKSKGRLIRGKQHTNILSEAVYRGKITDAHWVENGKRVFLGIDLENSNKQFVNFINDEYIERYPFSNLIAQISDNEISVEEFIGHNVEFEIKNKNVDGREFSNIVRINKI